MKEQTLPTIECALHTLDSYDSISLAELGSVKLMNRVDTKFVVPAHIALQFIEMASGHYRVQEAAGHRISEYCTTYLDTPDRAMYTRHAKGRKTRQKIRMRTYVDSNLSFLEVKRKSNRGRTDKRRIPIASMADIDTARAERFIDENSNFTFSNLSKALTNRFHRVTLVNHGMTERLTIDLGLEFYNDTTGTTLAMHDIAVMEVKRDGRTHSPALALLKQLRATPSGFSKYVIGMALTDRSLPHHLLNGRLRYINRLASQNQTLH